MKKIVAPLITLVVGFGIGYLIFNNQNQSSNHLAESPNSEKLFVDISYKEAKVLVDNFRDHGREDVTGDINGAHDRTKAIWFSYDQIKGIYESLTKEKSNGVGTDGLRIYLARYPILCPKCTASDSDIKYDPTLQVNRNTLVMVSTKTSSTDTSIHVDYFDTTGRTQFFMNPMPPQNRGELCQPNCNGATLTTP